MTGYRADPGDGAGTDWSAYDVPAIWSMVADFDPGPQWRHVTGWQRACSLTERHLTEMRSFRDRLAAAWPLSPGSASSAYVAELDRLIASVQATYDAATANHGVMSAATHAIAAVRDQLEPVYEQWQAHESAMAAYESAVESSRSGPLPTPMPGPPPVPVSWRDELNARARGVMEAVSGELALASLRIETPPGYTAPATAMRVEQAGGTGIGTALVAPAIPPVRSGAQVATARPKAPSSMPGSAPRRDVTDLRVPTPPRPTGASGIVEAARSLRGSNGPRPAGQGAVGARQSQSATGRIGKGWTAPSGPSLPSGMVITSPGQGMSDAHAGKVPRVNPPGGIVGAILPPGHARSPHPGRAGRAGSCDGSRSPGDAWDPDHPWRTDTGVAPIVEPDRPQRYDPGPAIGLGPG